MKPLWSLLCVQFLVCYAGAAVAKPIKPVSISYENVIRCFPELKDDRISFKVDLNILKDVIDERFVTSQSVLRQRKVHYLDPEGHLMNLILRSKPSSGSKLNSELTLQQVDSKGVVTNVEMTLNQRINPKQEIINNFLLGSTIKSDEYSYNDTKLNGLVLRYRRNFKEVQEVELQEGTAKRSVFCENKSDLGIICTCTKK